MDERDCPDQIMLGAKDRRYCILIGLAVHLETWIASGGGLQCPFVFGIRGSKGANATKDNVAAYLKIMFCAISNSEEQWWVLLECTVCISL